MFRAEAKPMKTAERDRTAWLEERRKGIGGSDAAMIMGLSRWGGPFSVYQDKVNGVREELDSDAVHFGTVLEDIVAREFAAREGVKVRRRNRVQFSEEHPFMLANIDRELVGQNIGLECKTANAFKGGEWAGDELPQEYYVQVQHYCSVMGWEACWIACLIGGQKFVYKLVTRNDGFIADMIGAERDFWENHVIPKIPPALGSFDRVDLAQETGAMLAPTERDLEYAAKLARVKEQIKELETHAALLTNIFKERIGENAGIEGVATWKQNRPSAKVDWEAVAKELNAPLELIERHTTEKQGARPFLLKFKEAV